MNETYEWLKYGYAYTAQACVSIGTKFDVLTSMTRTPLSPDPGVQ